MFHRCLPLTAAVVLLLGTARAHSAEIFVPFGLGNPVFNYGYGGYGGYGGWGSYSGGIGFSYYPRNYGAFTNYGFNAPYLGTAYAGWNTNPYYNGVNATLGAQANYIQPAAYSGVPISYVATARTTYDVPAAFVIPDQPARIIVHAPADAELWFDGRPTTQTGSERIFTTPQLKKGESYHYTVKARWKEGGKVVEQSERVPVYAGARVTVTFPRPK